MGVLRQIKGLSTLSVILVKQRVTSSNFNPVNLSVISRLLYSEQPIVHPWGFEIAL